MTIGPIDYVENGYAMHVAIAASGNRIWNENGVWLADDAPAVQAIINAYDPLAPAQAAQIALVNSACQAALGKITAAYPALEVATWPQQLAEATAWAADNTAVTPLLTEIIAVCGTPIATFAASVLANSQAFEAASGAAVGKRRLLTAQINAATTVEAVLAVVWS